jgi:predicted Rossmann fold nucleotide-binding protein DprA/Smf involved in DNA uptake
MRMVVDAPLKAWLTLSLTRGLGSESARRLLKEFGSPEAVISASISSLKSFLKPDVAAEISAGIAEDSIASTLAWLEDANNHIFTLADDDYPRALLNIPDPPLLLYAKGRPDLLNRVALAVVGSRNERCRPVHHQRHGSRYRCRCAPRCIERSGRQHRDRRDRIGQGLSCGKPGSRPCARTAWHTCF